MWRPTEAPVRPARRGRRTALAGLDAENQLQWHLPGGTPHPAQLRAQASATGLDSRCHS